MTSGMRQAAFDTLIDQAPQTNHPIGASARHGTSATAWRQCLGHLFDIGNSYSPRCASTGSSCRWRAGSARSPRRRGDAGAGQVTLQALGFVHRGRFPAGVTMITQVKSGRAGAAAVRSRPPGISPRAQHFAVVGLGGVSRRMVWPVGAVSSTTKPSRPRSTSRARRGKRRSLRCRGRAGLLRAGRGRRHREG